MNFKLYINPNQYINIILTVQCLLVINLKFFLLLIAILVKSMYNIDMDNIANLFNSINNEDKHILGIIQKLGPVTKNKIIDLTKKKLSTLNRSINRLENAGVISTSGTADSTGGRKPLLYDIIKTGYYIFGIDPV